MFINNNRKSGKFCSPLFYDALRLLSLHKPSSKLQTQNLYTFQILPVVLYAFLHNKIREEYEKIVVVEDTY